MGVDILDPTKARPYHEAQTLDPSNLLFLPSPCTLLDHYGHPLDR